MIINDLQFQQNLEKTTFFFNKIPSLNIIIKMI